MECFPALPRWLDRTISVIKSLTGMNTTILHRDGPNDHYHSITAHDVTGKSERASITLPARAHLPISAVRSVSYKEEPDVTEGLFYVECPGPIGQKVDYYDLISRANGQNAFKTFYGALADLFERNQLNACRNLLHLCLAVLGIDPVFVRSLRGMEAEVVSWTKDDWIRRWSESSTLSRGRYAQLCYCLDEFDQFRSIDLSPELLEKQHKALLRRLLGKSATMDPNFTVMANAIIVTACVGVFLFVKQ
ncbi:hypothetical protein ACJ73_07953 [Blastomyces percursus]|uniref:Uncharacterized protein n=1 Tax=Blastomyces percursus TaxID=1658174 RepID=A0A1J9PWI7_9EURO|nr:hypothetical protein ACJ73_07953 [Blastomyces percursus]